jgi:hypothetical protein
MTRISFVAYLKYLFATNYVYQIFGVLWLSLSLAVAYAEQPQEKFVIGDTKIALMHSEMSYSGFTYVGRDGLVARESVPRLTKAMVAHYSSNQSFADIDEVVSEISVAIVAEDKLWFGMSFYGGEGSDGIGGVGFFDPKLKKIGILRHPSLVNCSVKSLQITPTEIVALTYSQGELAEGICNGLVRISRKTLNSIVQFPSDNIQVIGDKDGGLTEAEKRVAKRYETAGSDLISHFSDWHKKAGQQFSTNAQRSFSHLGLEQFMLRQAEIEYRWFERAVKQGKIVFNQECKLTADGASSCEPSLRDISVEGKECFEDKAECTMADLIFLRQRTQANNYKYKLCTPQAWFAISLPIDGGKIGYVDWPVQDFFAPGRIRHPIDWGMQEQVPIVRPGYEASSYFRGKQYSFNVKAVEVSEGKCLPPHESASGPVITSVTLRATSVEVDQAYVLPELEY